MKSTQTQTEQNRAEKTTYVAIDAIIRVCDMGYGDGETEHALEHLRNVLSNIRNIPVRRREVATK